MMSDKLSAKDAQAHFNDSVFLLAEEFSSLQIRVVETPEQDNVMINAFPQFIEQNIYSTRHQYTKLDRYGTATESDVPGDAESIEVNGTKVTVDLPFYHADFVISKFDLETSRALGGRLDTIKAAACARKVDDKFDEALYKRTSLYGSIGARNLFTGSAGAAAVWSGADPYAIVNDVVNFVATIPAAYWSQNMRMVVEHVNYHEMARTNAQGLSAFEILRRNYPQLQILVSKQVTHGEGVLYPFRDDVAYVVQGFPRSVLEWDVKALEARYKVLRSGRLIVVAASAGVKLNGL